MPKADIEANGYDLSINRYKEVVHEQVQHRAPGEILAELRVLEDEIARGWGVGGDVEVSAVPAKWPLTRLGDICESMQHKLPKLRVPVTFSLFKWGCRGS